MRNLKRSITLSLKWLTSMTIRNFDENNNDVNNDKINNTITKLQGHPSIVAIKEQKKESNKTFTF